MINVTLPLYLTVGSDSAAAVAVLLPLWSLSNFAKAFRLTSCFWDGSVDNKISSSEIWSHLKVELNVMSRKLYKMICQSTQRDHGLLWQSKKNAYWFAYKRSCLTLAGCFCSVLSACTYVDARWSLLPPIWSALFVFLLGFLLHLSTSCQFTVARHTDACIWPTSLPGCSLIRHSVRTSRREAWLEPSSNLTAYMETE